MSSTNKKVPRSHYWSEKMQATDAKPVLESGKVTLAAGKLCLLKVNIAASNIDVSIQDKEFIQRALKLRSIFSSTQPATKEKEPKNKRTGSSPLETLRSVTETLCSRGITITVSYQGDCLLTLGAGAKPKLLHYVTGTRGLAINNVVKLARMLS